MRSGRLLHVAFEATRFLESSLSEEVSSHILAIDPDASEDVPFILVVTEEGRGDVCALLPTEITAQGCHVQVICRPTAKLEVH